ncbi:unnamed protein product [Meloidogyne enterolobii]|uniref:Uncharacterized protein n=1 Tax=Meloidogyne enterolobii TaxID=390850 RepID=A0ACB1AIF0_MELEN
MLQIKKNTLDFLKHASSFFEICFRFFVACFTYNFLVPPEFIFQILLISLKLSHWLLQLSPLLQSLFCLFGVSFYRLQLCSILQKFFFCFCCCCQHSKLDYSSETLRSILAEQTKKRQMNRGKN